MITEKKTIRSDIPGHHTFLNGSYAGSPADETRRMVVGREITLDGQVAACEHLVIEGTVKAQGLTARRMDILEPGLFTGSAEIQEAVIAGRFEGKLSVPGRLTVKSTGRITGEVSCGILEVEAGGRIDGTVIPLKTAPAPETAQPLLRKPVALPGRKLPHNVEALFDGQKAAATPRKAEQPAQAEKAKEQEKEEGDAAGAEGRPNAFRRVVGYH